MVGILPIREPYLLFIGVKIMAKVTVQESIKYIEQVLISGTTLAHLQNIKDYVKQSEEQIEVLSRELEDAYRVMEGQ